VHGLDAYAAQKNNKKDSKMRSPGIEPGSITWQATIITTRPRTQSSILRSSPAYNKQQKQETKKEKKKKKNKKHARARTGDSNPVSFPLETLKKKKKRKEKKEWIQHHTVPGWSPTPVLSGLKPR
jgi:hypothetical protein